jgi:hypothetical protein
MYSSESWGKAEMAGKPVPTRGVVGYLSEDGGETWRLAFAHKGGPQDNYCDPAVTFGPDGSAYFVCMKLNMKVWQRADPIFIGDPDAGCLELARSSDRGKTWGPMTVVPSYIDRPWIAVDNTTGRYRGRLYCLASPGKTWALFTSPKGDPAASVEKAASIPKTRGMSFAQASNLAVLSDGAVVFAHDQRAPDKKHRPVTTVLLSRDSGQTFQEVGRVNTAWDDQRLLTINRLFFPQLAADALGTRYRDRLYYVWEDGGEEARILFSSSGDRGRTWTAPLVLSEQPTGGPREKDYRAFMPSIAVNKHGTVAVSWYDRRSQPPDPGLPPTGYNVRMRVSLDGGGSWSPSVQLNEKMCPTSFGSLGDTAGIAADPAGHFHPVWIDDRTGTRQVWTRAVKVETD